MKSTLRLSVLLTAAACAVFATGCQKKPLRPNPYQTVVGGGEPSYVSPTSITDLPDSTLAGRGTTDNVARGKRGVLPNVYFDFDSAAIRAGERSKLTQAAEYLKSNPNARLLLEGHCDWRGTAEYNLGLGDRRANSVRQYMGTLGIPASRLETLSVGDRGATEGGNAAEMQEDRRVELAVLD